MTHEVWTCRLSSHINRDARRRLALSLTLCLLLSAVIQASSAAANSQFAPAQDQSRITAHGKFEEGEALRAQGTAESLRLAVKKYEEALPFWRAAGKHREEATTLSIIGTIYSSLGDKRKALDFFNRALRLDRALIAHGVTAVEKPIRSTTSAMPTIRWARIRRRSTSTPGRCRSFARLATAAEKP